MTATRIRAVVFDMGGTLEDIYYDERSRLVATHGLMGIMDRNGLHLDLSPEELLAVIESGMKKYQDWREKTELELPPERVWPEFIVGDRLPVERLAAAAEELALFYDLHYYSRQVRPEVHALLPALRERGLLLAVISNVYSRGAVPFNLAAYGLESFFPVVVTSACYGWRKPNPRIFLEAARQLKVPPAACAYVGDTVSRDVVGAHRAGYGLAIQIKSFLTSKADRETDVEPPDAVIENLLQVIPLVADGLA